MFLLALHILDSQPVQFSLDLHSESRPTEALRGLILQLDLSLFLPVDLVSLHFVLLHFNVVQSFLLL